MTQSRMINVAPMHAYVSAHYEAGGWRIQVRAYADRPEGQLPDLTDQYDRLTTDEAYDVLASVTATLLDPRPWEA